MKTPTILGLLLTCSLLQAQTINQTGSTANPPTLPAPTPYAVASRDANSAIWQQTTYEQAPDGSILPHIHGYTELSTGLNHLVNGHWVASSESINISPDGSSASATNGQHQVYFPGNIYSGSIRLVTPDGITLQSQPIGLSYFDGSNSVLLATVTNSTGAILSSGTQVIYTNAFAGLFAGLNADIIFSYTKVGMEQDVVLRQQPPDPSALGLNPATTRLQMLTEFVAAPQPNVTAMTLPTDAGNLEDDSLSFGAMQMGAGKAFLIGTKSPSVRVEKRWLTLNGRQFLIEEVPIVSIATAIDSLPPFVAKAGSGTKPIVSKNLILPPQRPTHITPKTVFLAKATPPSRGLDIDYVMMISQTNWDFQGDTTYYISGSVNLFKTNTFEGGAVLKYATNASVTLEGNCVLNWVAAPYRPVIFTAVDDNSVGETISGSSGSPSGGNYAAPALLVNISGTVPPITNFRIAYAQMAIEVGGTTSSFYDGQIVDCRAGFYGPFASCTLRNVLFSGVGTDFYNLDESSFDIQNATFNSSAYLTTINNSPYSGAQVYLTNCIFANVTNLQSVYTYTNYAPYQVTGAYNGFYNCQEFGANAVTNTFYPFQTAGAGGYYLASGCAFVNAGTTNIDSTLLASLAQKTTYPPIAYTNYTFTNSLTFNPQAQRDTDIPDLGYHYDPLDYSFGGCIANSNLTFTAGTAVGWFRTTSGWQYAGYGIHMGTGVTVSFNGTATAPTCWVRLNTVQEQDLTGGYGPGGIESWTDTDSPLLIGHFLHCSMVGYDGGSRHFSDDYGNIQAELTDSEIWGGTLGVYQDYMYYTNCLMWRVGTWLLNGTTTSSYTLRNCTFFGGQFLIQRNSSGPTPVSVRDCSFDGTSISTSDYWSGNTNFTDYDYNAYTNGTDPFSIGGSHDHIMTNGFNWQSSWFGNFYLPTNSLLLNAGDVLASQVGLYHFTILTNQVPEGTNTVSIGYHYVAVDANGNPLDSNGDGIPDYLEDPDGDGIVNNGETNWALAILTQPANQTVAQGSNATFSVTVGGIAPIQYQWYFNSTTLANATNSTLPLNNVQTNNAGNYFVIVTNNFGSLTSSVATLTVVVPPTISITNPSNNTVIIASQTNVTLIATASNAIASIVQVQFFQGTTNLGVVTTPPYNLVWSNVTAGNYALTAVASNNFGLTATSSVVNITVTPLFATNTVVLWLKGDAIAGLTTNNAPINTWPDSSGWGHNATQSTLSYEPLYETNAVNGLPVAQFNGANNYFALATFLNNTTGAEAFLVIKAATNLPTSNQGLWNIGTAVNHWTYYPNTAGEIADCFGSAVSPYNYDIGIPAQPLNQYHLYEVSSQTNNWMAWINGSLLYETTNNTYAYGPSDLGRASLSGYGDAYFAGDIAEILVFSRGLSSVERGIVDSYLNCKYVLVTNAPVAPANLLAAAVSTDQVSLTWSFSLGTSPTVFTIERKLGSGGSYALVATVQDTTSYLDTDLTTDTQYYYKVMASNWAGQSGYSNETNATTLAGGAEIPLNSLVLWLKADSGVEWLINGSVWTWSDQSGNHNDVSQKTSGYQSVMGLQPRYVTNAVSGRPALQFDGTNYFFTMPNILNNTIGAEAFLVIKAATNLPVSPQGLWNIGTAVNHLTLYPNNTGEIDDCFASAVNYYYHVGIPAQPLNQYHLYDVSSQTGYWGAWVNGQLQFQTNNNVYAVGPSDLGRTDDQGYDNYFAGDIAEILVFNRPLAGSEKIAVGTYLFSKYNLLAYATNSSPPSSPTNVISTGLAPDQLNLQWARTSTNETAFSIERKTDATGTYQIVGSTTSSVTNFVDITAIAASTNYYRIRSLNYFGNSGYSPEISPPSLSLTNWPATILANTTNLIGAQAADANGTINSVGFYVGAANQEILLGTATTAPYTANWVSGREGPWSLAALATDSLGNSQYSSAVTVTVYLDSNGDGIPDIFQVQNGDDPLNPWTPPAGDTNSTPPTINLIVPANATLLQ